MSRKSKLTTQKITRLALLTAAAVVLGYMEGLIAPLVALPPGIKLGLGNTAVLYSIYTLGPGYSVILLVLKVLLTSLMSGNLSTAIYSTAGGVLSLVMMLLVKNLSRGKVSIVGVSVVGAAFHNIGQISVFVLMTGTAGLFYYACILTISAVITGTLTGLAGKQIIRVLKIPGAEPGKSGTKAPPKEGS